MAEALGIQKDEIVEATLHETSQNLILVLNAAATVVRVKPCFSKLVAAAPAGVSKVTITAVPLRRAAVLSEGGYAATSSSSELAGSSRSNSVASDTIASEEESQWQKYDFVSRLFAPWIGIPEDAVSGASHAILAQFWRTRNAGIREKSTLLCFQSSPRGGEILLSITGTRVGVSGEAVTIASGRVSVKSGL
jgi:predicted PhzF superfamily epimerase YddE/YHI9